jgi:spermidine synthase
MLIIALLSLSLISVEIIWTRIFSAEYFYTFAFMIISLAILGLGLGALSLRLFNFLNKDWIVGITLVLSGLTILAGPIAIIKMNLDFTSLFNDWISMVKLIAAIAILSSTFFFGGIALAKLFKSDVSQMPLLYMSDLIGAAFGVLLSVIMMNSFGTPSSVFLTSIPIFIAAFIAMNSWRKLLPALLVLIAIGMSPYSNEFLKSGKPDRAEVIYTYWDAMAKIKIFDYNGQARGINIDNAANSPVYPFDGNYNKPDSLKYEYNISVKNLIDRFDSCTFLSLGAGGGTDVLQALQEGAAEVHAVEVIDHINYLMTEGNLADYSGNIYNDQRVKVITEDGRAYVRRFENKFDIIYSLSSNTFAALASGSFALAENYLFTTEAFQDYWNSLTDSGFVMMEHQFYVPRLTSELMLALEELDVENPTSHFAVYNLPKMRRNILFISKQPLTEELMQNAFGEVPQGAQNYHYLLYPAADSVKDNLINQIVTKGWETAQVNAAIDISPCNDNRPFTAQLGLMRNFQFGEVETILPYEFYGFPLSKIIITVILLIVVFLIVPLNLIPYLKKGPKLRAVPWLYFFAIGLAFMMVEVVLMQKYTLFIGPSVYSIITILLVLLLASGIGSRYSEKFSPKFVFTFISIWLLIDVVAFTELIYALGGLTMAPRIIITAILIFPLGFFMGMPFPKGSLLIGELVDWGFAVNGAASVLGSTIVVLIAFSFGYATALFLGAVIYLLAYLLISFKRAW